MTKIDKKLYEKAMDKFNNGEIDKSLEICEQCIAEDLKNSAALNLKGLIMYLQGKGQEAKTTWEANVEYNKDEVAKNYLKSLDNDISRLKKYESAIKKIENFDITEGIEELESITDSDFNLINNCNALTYAYIKKGEFKEALKYNKKVLVYDRSNKLALDYFKEISTYYDVEDLGIDIKVRKNYKLIGGIVAIALVGVIGVVAYKNINNNKLNDKNTNIVAEQEKVDEHSTVDNEKEKEKEEIISKETINAETLKKAKEDEDYKKMADELKYVNIDKLNEEDKKLVEECLTILGNDGVGTFYTEGRKAYKNGEYKKAEEELQYAYDYSEESYLRPHIIYMLAANYEKDENVDKAIKYYKQYVEEYSDVEYAPECAYKVALLNKDINDVESKKYASMFKDKYSDSMYYNSNIKEILGEE